MGIDVKPRGHPVSVHDAVSDLSVDPHVGVLGLDAQHQRPRWLVLQHGGVQAVVLTLRGRFEIETLEQLQSKVRINWTRTRGRRLVHLPEDRLVVVDVVDPHDDLGGAAERERAAGRVVVRGRDVEDVLRSSQPGGGAPPQLDDACDIN